MSTGRGAGHDEGDALSWDGDDDPTLDVDAAPRRTPGRPRPSTPAPTPAVAQTAPARVRSAGKTDETDEAVPGEPVPLGNVGLVAIGMIAMAFIGYAVGWVIAGIRLLSVEGLPVPAGTLGALMTVAALSPLIWFLTTYLLTRHTRPWVRFTWLVAGLLLLVPWPFLVTGALA